MMRLAKSAPIWTAFEAAAATGGRLCLRGEGGEADGRSAADDWSASGIAIDSRKLEPGQLFVALQDNRDGHEFLEAAAKAGASAALVSYVPDSAPIGFPLLKVPDTLKALESLAKAARDRNFGRLVAVTGSAGKTSTKEMLRAALGASGRVHAASASFNNHIGVPVTVSSLPAYADYGVFEIGMNHAGEITPLSQLCQPHVAIITTVAPAHLAAFNSVDEIAAAKAEILAGLRGSGVAILPADNEYFKYLGAQAKEQNVERIIPFGESEFAKAGVQLLDYQPQDDGSAIVKASVLGEEVQFDFHAPGKHQALNAMAVLAACYAVNAPLDLAVQGLSNFRPGDGRGASHHVQIEGKHVQILDESYNANPASMAAALAVLGTTSPKGEGRRLAVLGEMKELGPNSPSLHAQLAGPIAAAQVEKIWAAGNDMSALTISLPEQMVAAQSGNANELLEDIVSNVKDGDVILFKGSNASGIGELLKAFLAKSDQPG